MDLINKSKHFSIKILMSQGLHMCNLWSVMYILQLAIHMHNQSIDRILNVLFFFLFFFYQQCSVWEICIPFCLCPFFFFFHLHGKTWSLAWFSIEVNFAEVTGAFFYLPLVFCTFLFMTLLWRVPERSSSWKTHCLLAEVCGTVWAPEAWL